MSWKKDVERWREDLWARLLRTRNLLLRWPGDNKNFVLKRILVLRLREVEDLLGLEDAERWWPRRALPLDEAVRAFEPPEYAKKMEAIQ